MSVLSYLGNVNIGIHLVEKLNPQAVLYEVDGSTSDGKPTNDTANINKLRFGNNTIILNSGPLWGEWAAPIYVDQPTMDDIVIPWPIDMDIKEAQKLKDEAGYKTDFTTVTLRWPLYPGNSEPYYIFGLKGYYVFVGVYSGKVFTEDMNKKKKPE
ncbi:hypothetical protein CPB83DRAFT_909970 [Crepidotus variabilis]|uniref:Uncharacterized protein n=1 Tax=Crepidotus variabilis TaxID=179855 RepID=A0A9P6E8E1_9AGAR|nr:hypothetical protein CPB83DRAFT_909970 [Crepidotus variabilis]